MDSWDCIMKYEVLVLFNTTTIQHQTQVHQFCTKLGLESNHIYQQRTWGSSNADIWPPKPNPGLQVKADVQTQKKTFRCLGARLSLPLFPPKSSSEVFSIILGYHIGWLGIAFNSLTGV